MYSKPEPLGTGSFLLTGCEHAAGPLESGPGTGPHHLPRGGSSADSYQMRRDAQGLCGRCCRIRSSSCKPNVSPFFRPDEVQREKLQAGCKKMGPLIRPISGQLRYGRFCMSPGSCFTRYAPPAPYFRK
ncbi:hypothetical protein CALVIDRAFT_218198 [Calocera viscosa TUFC12733]|uniref:Uncharacterized protein n=1 Tax=Calocera viscosa (strain TUFC12733) TaxID=1330018 RepID=A0A167RIT0_CALVF|nr:hypothetical protein CALVIDRAFT_218198 [Calocera viscosa TUFC12733]